MTNWELMSMIKIKKENTKIRASKGLSLIPRNLLAEMNLMLTFIIQENRFIDIGIKTMSVEEKK